MGCAGCERRRVSEGVGRGLAAGARYCYEGEVAKTGQHAYGGAMSHGMVDRAGGAQQLPAGRVYDARKPQAQHPAGDTSVFAVDRRYLTQIAAFKDACLQSKTIVSNQRHRIVVPI
jgi:hypothetical protein